MDELRESSLLFSLEGLLETERQRVEREAREAQKRRANELQRVAEAAERRRVAHQQEREAHARREALLVERERIEQERGEAMKRAAIERARLEVEAKIRLAEVEQGHSHHLALSRIREAQTSLRYRAVSWLSSAALVLTVLGAGSAYFGWLRPAQTRAAQQLQRLIDASSARANAAERALSLAHTQNRALRANIQLLQANVPPPLASPSASASPKSRPGAPLPARAQDARRCKDSGDPLDSCIR